MNTAKNTTTSTHKTLLAGVGAYDSAREKAADKFDQLFVSGSQLVNELLEKGESVEAELYAKLEVKNMFREKIATLKAKLGFGNNATDQQLDMLNQRVDSLIEVVAKLAQQQAAEQKTPVKTVAKAKPTAQAKTTKTTKAAAKPAAKAKATKTAAKAETKTSATTKPVSKAKATNTPAKATTVKTAKKTTGQPAEKAAAKAENTSATAKTETKTSTDN